MSTHEKSAENQVTGWLLIWGLALGLTMWFWLDLWLGGGLIGGDIYSYYFPQKTFLADSLQAGTPPEWNPLVGFGYPAAGESQTAIYYPPNQLLYRYLDVNTAYNISHLLHYVLAFIATVLLAREFRLSRTGAVLTGLVFVYGWFPSRSCLEWAIITGAYFPLNFWLIVRYTRTFHAGWLWGLAFSLGLQLLAGHYNLAFISLLTIAGWLCLFPLISRRISRKFVQKPSLTESAESTPVPSLKLSSLFLFPALAVALGVLMASAQLFPSWELKQQSQRQSATPTQDFDPNYGYMPADHLRLLILPFWSPVAAELDSYLNQRGLLRPRASTNQVEAHLYFGLIPFLLAVAAVLITGQRYRRHRLSETELTTSIIPLLVLSILGILGLLYAVGWLTSVLSHWPGFSYFRGPGRYSIVIALAGACWAGKGWDLIRPFVGQILGQRWQIPVWGCLFFLTLLDLSVMSQRITYAFMVPRSPITLRETSPLRKMLKDRLPPARILSPGPNLLTSTGLTSTPVYLGLGPAAYFDRELTMPESPDNLAPFGQDFTTEQIRWMQQAGVTHVLGFAPPQTGQPELQLVWSGIDPFLNTAWGRAEPLYLSELTGSRERASWLPVPEEETGTPSRNLVEPTLTWMDYEPHYQKISLATPQDRTLIFTDLYDENWKLYLDETPQAALLIEGLFRGAQVPEGNHTLEWRYEPSTFVHSQRGTFAGFTIWLLMGTGLLLNKKFIRKS